MAKDYTTDQYHPQYFGKKGGIKHDASSRQVAEMAKNLSATDDRSDGLDSGAGGLGVQRSKLPKGRWSKSMDENHLLTFPTQRPNEHVVLLLRRHWTVLARDVIQLVLSLILPPAITALLLFYTPFTLEAGTPLYTIVVEGFSLFYLFTFLAYFHDFIDYHLDIWVVTDQRVVSVEQEGLFNRVVAELNVQRIQDVTSEVKGKVQTFLDYGQVHIQTAGEKERFVFEEIPHPSEVAKVILQVHEQALRKMEMEKMRKQVEYQHQFAQQNLQHTMDTGYRPTEQYTPQNVPLRSNPQQQVRHMQQPPPVLYPTNQPGMQPPNSLNQPATMPPRSAIPTSNPTYSPSHPSNQPPYQPPAV